MKVAARQFGVPVMTLRDRVLGKVSLETTKPGPDSLFSMEEELTLVEHLETMAQMGYGYTHAQLNPLVPNHRKHCPKTFILPTVTNFGKYITKLYLKLLGGKRSRRYVCIIYATLDIMCSKQG